MPIEQRDEGAPWNPDYSGRVLTPAEIAKGHHRSWVGGRWDSGHGQAQLDFLVARGLRPEHQLVDVGCGSFRAGRHFVDYLQPRHYFGVDANRSVLYAGYEHELTDVQRERLPESNLRINDRFDVDFGTAFDFALAQSVFTHVSLNHVRLCLYRVARAMRPGGVFYATFYERPWTAPVDHVWRPAGVKPRYTERNVFWYYRADLEWAASFAPWRADYVGDWGHPAGQLMMAFTRLPGDMAEPLARQAPRQRYVTRGRRWLARHIAP